MTNNERKEARYQRRQEKRKRNAAARSEQIGTLESVFSFDTMFCYGHKCCNGVRWKQSVQNFERHLLVNTSRNRRRVLDETWRPYPCVSFTLMERGKIRHIDAPHILDRQIHKTLVNEVLIPIYRPHMIEDNAASRVGGGLHFQYSRIKKQLGRHFRKHGRQGGILLLDLAGFFPNANRALIIERHSLLIDDPGLRELADKAVLLSPEASPGHGMALGLELSQIEMTALPTAMDQWLKCQCHIAGCGHYMDDYYVICEDTDRLKGIANDLIRRFEDAGIPINRHKVHIQPLTKPFRFCKAKFTLTESGRVIINRCRKGMKRARRKLHMLARGIAAGTHTMADVDAFMESQRAYYKQYDDHGRVLRLERMYHAIFKSEVTDT